MSGQRGRGLQLAAVFVLLVAYSGLSHYSNIAADSHHLGPVLSLAPEVTVGFLLVWRWASPLAALITLALLLAATQHFWPTLNQHFAWAFLGQDLCLYGLLAWGFGRSLRGGGVAVCTRLADQVHGPLNPAEVAYTRAVTAAWTLFFIGILTVSCVLFRWAPLRIWSTFANLCVLPLIGLMFVAEYWVRRRVLPDVKKAGLLATVRVYMASPQ